MSSREEIRHGVLISAATEVAAKKVEEQLIAAIAACEDDVRRGVEDLARLKPASSAHSSAAN